MFSSLPEEFSFVLGKSCRWREDGEIKEESIVELSTGPAVEAVKLDLDDASAAGDVGLNYF